MKQYLRNVGMGVSYETTEGNVAVSFKQTKKITAGSSSYK